MFFSLSLSLRRLPVVIVIVVVVAAASVALTDTLTISGFFFVGSYNDFSRHMLDSQSFPLLWDYDDYKLPLYGAYRFSNGSMKVYSRQEVHDLILYAADRGILVVPEFESPGHATVWGNAYPEMLSCANVSLSSPMLV